MPDEAQRPTVGRIVLYVLEEGPNAGQVRPAIVIRTWGNPPATPYPIQLGVFVDGTNDLPMHRFSTDPPVVWKTSVVYDGSGRHGTWHWPERD